MCFVTPPSIDDTVCTSKSFVTQGAYDATMDKTSNPQLGAGLTAAKDSRVYIDKTTSFQRRHN